MNQEIKDKWLDALKSGNYVQGTGRLKCKEKHCCLGVLGEVLGLEIDSGGMSFVGEKCDSKFPYPALSPFLEEEDQRELYIENDSKPEGLKDYSNVIPLIESL